ncbi:2612_t:CDS:2 [Entrophospora sp. SA101]|nr:15136_t:CDS:2 [Entrophospora sp. SA101]CAJ0639064.1 2612_t:CDS:2 [Entrophospora sp. SA101]CAJ0828162.1 11101_t:CDS:2 [Entrophospora sp. SA101]CAJ0846212.1 9396_t:CDS:2 [Entrophospora sp. SA101]
MGLGNIHQLRMKQVIESEQTALSIIDSLLDNSLITKTGYITVGTGLLTLAISKELYVLNEETLLLLSFSTMCATIYRALKQPVSEWVVTQKINSILRQTREDHKSAVVERIETVGQIGNLKAVAASEIKAVLDS